MKIISLFIGNELLNGQTANANLVSLGTELMQAGYTLNGSETLPDCKETIANAVIRNTKSCDVILICGGLGPTSDDITREAVAGAVGAELDHSAEVRKGLQEYMERKGRKPSEEYYHRQSEVIKDSLILNNRIGLAPGLLYDSGGVLIFLLPGPPREYKPMLTEEVIPRLNRLNPPHIKSQIFNIYGLSESQVESLVQPLMKKFPYIDPAYCTNLGHVKLTLAYPVKYADLATEFHDAVFKIFGNDVTTSDQLIDSIAPLLGNKDWTLGTAESCTGGWVGQAVTSYAGASSFFQGSINTYANEWKMNQLGVTSETLKSFGAVSEECAGEMVNGLCERYNLDCGIAVTGIAGPGGGSTEKPVGTVYVATRIPSSVKICRYSFGGSRKEIREQTVRFALNQLRLELLAANV